jgi:nitrite reductase/ring-hydroxylating ferredoxin subunit
MDETIAGRDTPTSRRAVLGGAAVLGAGAVLAACGGSSESSTPPTKAMGNGGGSMSSGAGTPVGKAADVPVGSGIYSEAAKAFVTQPTGGDFKGFDAICTHKQCPMTRIEGDTITCQCHGSQFSAIDGSVKHGPATTPLTAVKVVEKNGNLFVQG